MDGEPPAYDPASVLSAAWRAPEAIMIVGDAEGRVVDATEGAARLFGYGRVELVGQDIERLLHEDSATEHRQAYRAATRSGSPVGGRHHGLARRRDGSVVRVEGSVAPISGPGAARWLAVFRAPSMEDADDESTQLVAAQRMELLGQLASGVAHDLNNLLTPILAAAELLDGAVHGDEARADLMAISHAAHSGRQLLRQLLFFARHDRTTPEPTDVADITSRAVSITARNLPDALELRWEPPVGLPRARVDAVQIEQVLLNLLANAVYASRGHGGEVSVRLDGRELDAATAPDGRAGSYLRLAVCDQGPGVPATLAGRIFEPFFTTKPAGVGTGLGLHVSRRIATQCGGDLRLEPSAEGACFALYLPVAHAESLSAQPGADAPSVELGLSRVLAVDDDPAALRALTRLLSRFGVSAAAFVDPAEALAWLSRGAERRVDAVLTDHSMPAMTGAELAESVRRVHRDLPIVLVSGWGRTLADRRVFDAVLAKPYGGAELVGALHRARRAASARSVA